MEISRGKGNGEGREGEEISRVGLGCVESNEREDGCFYLFWNED